jgi:Na+/H+ antiporter NhaA
MCAIVLALPRQPLFASVLIFTFLLLRWSPLPPESSFIAAVIHNSLVGIAGGLTVAAFALVISMNVDDQAVARAAMGILTGPLVGMIFGWIWAVAKRR